MKQIPLLNYYIILFLFIAPSLGMQNQYNNPTKNYFSQLKNTIYQHKTPCTATISVVLTLCCLYKIKEMIQNNKTLFTSTILSHCLLIYLLYRYPKNHFLNNNIKEFSPENCYLENPYDTTKNINNDTTSIKNSPNQLISNKASNFNEIIKNHINNSTNKTNSWYYAYYVRILEHNNNINNPSLTKIIENNNIDEEIKKNYNNHKEFTQFFVLNYYFTNKLIKNKTEINQQDLIAQLKKIEKKDVDDFFTTYNSEEQIKSLINDRMDQLSNLMQTN